MIRSILNKHIFYRQAISWAHSKN